MFIGNRINNHKQPHRGGMSSHGFDEPNNVLRIVSHDMKNHFGVIERSDSCLPAFIIDMHRSFDGGSLVGLGTELRDRSNLYAPSWFCRDGCEKERLLLLIPVAV